MCPSRFLMKADHLILCDTMTGCHGRGDQTQHAGRWDGDDSQILMTHFKAVAATHCYGYGYLDDGINVDILCSIVVDISRPLWVMRAPAIVDPLRRIRARANATRVGR